MVRIVQLLVIGITLVLSGCGDSPSPSKISTPKAETPAPANTDMNSAVPTIVFLGDSLTAGFGLEANYALPDQVQARLNADGKVINIINAGVSGDTSANGLARYDWSVKSVNPNFVLIALGANDYLNGTDPAQTKINLKALIQQAQADGISVILAGIESRSIGSPNERDITFAKIYPDLAEEFNLPLYPALLAGVRDNPGLLQNDGLHPTKDGVDIMSKNLTEFLRPIVENNDP